jgi:hypothetical protein
MALQAPSCQTLRLSTRGYYMPRCGWIMTNLLDRFSEAFAELGTGTVRRLDFVRERECKCYSTPAWMLHLG